MKRKISIILSVIILASSLLVATSAFAKNDIVSPETTIPHIHVTVTLNGKDSENTSYDVIDPDKGLIHFHYKGGGILIGWDFEYNEYPLVEGVDYEIIEEKGNDLIIQILPGYKGENFWVNAVDDLNETTNPAKKDDNQKSPNTGGSFTIIACVTGIGATALATRKRRK